MVFFKFPAPHTPYPYHTYSLVQGVGMRLLAKAKQERESAADDRAKLAELEKETLPLAKKQMRLSDEKIRGLNDKVNIVLLLVILEM